MSKDIQDKIVAEEVSTNRDRFVSGTNYADDQDVAARALRHVVSDVERMRNQRTRLENKWLLCYKLWDGTPLSKYTSSAESVHVPEPYKAVEAAVPRIRRGLTGSAEWFRPTASTESSVQNLRSIQEVLHSDLYEDHFEQKISAFIRDVLIYGDCPGKVYWKYRAKSIVYNQAGAPKVTTNGPVITSKTPTMRRGVPSVVVEDHPTFDIRDIYDFYTDALRFDLQESPGNAEAFVRTIEHLRQMEMVGLYKNVDKLLATEQRKAEEAEEARGQSAGAGGLYAQSYGDRRHDASGGTESPTNARPGEYRLLEYWGWFDLHDDGNFVECVITVAEDHTVLQVRRNPMWHGIRPYVSGHGNRSSNRFYSKGLVEVIVRLCMELDDTRNLRLEAAHLNLSPMFRASYDFAYSGNELTARSGQIFRGERGSIEPIYQPSMDRAAESTEQAIKRDIQEVTGMPSLYQGQRSGGSGGAVTATEVATMAQEANTRIEETAYNIGVFALSPMLEMFHALDQEYISKAKEISILGLDGIRAGIKKVSPEQIAGQVRIDILTLPEISLVGLHAAQMTRYLGSMGDLIVANPGLVDVKELMKLGFTQTFGYKHVDRIFPDSQRPEDQVTPGEENLAIISGHADQVLVKPADKDLIHLQVHQGFMDTQLYERQEELTQRQLAAHIQNHILQLEQKSQAAMPVQPDQMMAQGAGMAAGGGPGGGRQAPGPQSLSGVARSGAAMRASDMGVGG